MSPEIPTSNWSLRKAIGLGHSFPNRIVLEQLSARQPHVLLILLFYVLPFWLLEAVIRLLLLWPSFDDFAGNYPQSYKLVFFISQIFLICSVVIFASTKYSSSLWKPRLTNKSIRFRWLIFLLPALCYYAYRCFWLLKWWFNITRDSNVRLDQIHAALWNPLPYDASFAGVIFSSTIMITGPVFEEIIFTGFLLNWLLKKASVPAAVLIVPAIFTFAHIPQQGLGMHLLPIFFSGLGFVLIRLSSGNLSYSVIGHTAVNIIFLLPAWIEAYIFFTS